MAPLGFICEPVPWNMIVPYWVSFILKESANGCARVTCFPAGSCEVQYQWPVWASSGVSGNPLSAEFCNPLASQVSPLFECSVREKLLGQQASVTHWLSFPSGNGVLKSHIYLFRSRAILKAAPSCCGQSDSSQHRAVLGSGKERETARTSGAVA